MTTLSTLPKVMKAAVVDAAGPPEAIHIKEVPIPALPSNHVLIALEYVGVGIWDAEQRAGSWGSVKPGTIMGADGSGTIAAVGSHVTRFRVGDRVYSYSYGNGGFYAQYVSVPADRVAPVPAHLDMKIAGGMPCIALTAQSGLETLKVTRGQTVLVFGASGGVGSCAVWLGSEKGATVVGTARPEAQEYVRSLGAAHTIDPNSSEREGAIKRAAKDGFDAALVTADSNALASFFSHLKPKAPIAFPNGVEPEPRFSGHPASAFDGAMSHEAFEKLNAAISTRTLPLRVQVFSFQDVAAAHRRIEEGHVVGKIVLHIDL
ncbi:putative oxidoreductase [Acidisarcina polymorpha]|uniref:Putative oxidoreductase n=1 Tax=Acidisarcina polymorpha TaxID=2211140 RepID=A0A2Z5G6D6_9BACT|nr:NADP-dependent oxidoreductase [Acidisarcina polymorpha]AXC14549.1 putative oxidoreductase [Acidisarcina polymorpha]